MILYNGDGGNAQQEYIKHAEVGWKRVLNTHALHVSESQTQYEYLETVDDRLTGAAKKCHRDYLDRMDWTKPESPDLQHAILRKQN